MNSKGERILRALSKIIYAIYIVLLVWVVMLKCNLVDSIYQAYLFVSEQTLSERFLRFIVPFKDYTEQIFNHQISTLIEDDILNVLIFIPFGLYTAYFFKGKKFAKLIVVTLLVSLFFEFFQLFSLLGSFSTKDLITNLLGSVLGYLLYRLIYKEQNGKIKLLILNVASLAVIFIVAPIFVYAIVNTVKNFDIYVDVILRRLVV